MTQSNPKSNWLARIFSGSRSSNRTVSRKILTPVIIFTGVLMLFLSVYMFVSARQRDRVETEDTLNRLEQIVIGQLGNMETLALGLATQSANSPEIQAAFAAQDRELLTEITLPSFEIFNQEFAVKQYQYFLPPATSFLRVHQLDRFGDDLSPIRKTFLKMDETRAAVSGTEIGRGGLGVRGVVPVFHEGNYIGGVEFGLDIGIDFLENLKKEYGVEAQIMLEKEAATASTFAGATAETAGPTENLLFQASTLPVPFYADASIYPRVLAGESVISTVTVNDRTYAAISLPLRDYSDKVIGVLDIFLDRTDILAAQSRNLLTTILISLAVLALGGFLITRLINYTVQPIGALTETATAVAGGDLKRQAVVQSNDEIGTLAAAFNTMTSQLRGLFETMEQRIADRTQSLELAAEVGRSVSEVRALDVMLKDAAELIRSKFDLYYTQVYLANEAQSTLILSAGTGSVGAELLGRGHRLPMNTASINGRAAVEKRSIVISDTTASATFRPNPLLPETRSEMSIPLMIGEKVVGVLDLQGRTAGVLNQDDLPAFEALAGQLAIAIQNASLLAETEEARAEVEKQARRLVRTNWDEHLDAIHRPEQTAFAFEGNQVLPLAEGYSIPANENSITTPIAITGESIGTLIVEMDAEDQSPHHKELINVVARQMAQQIENLRLLESTERYRAEAEQAARRLSAEGWKEYMNTRSAERLGYLYDMNEVLPISREQLADGTGLTLPIKAREETVGKLLIKDIDTNDTASLELASAVIERLGTHIESLRQFEQTQSALAQSERLFTASNVLSQAADLQDLVKGAVETLDIPEVNRAILGIFEYGPNDELSGLSIAANWWNGSGHEATPVGARYSIETLRVLPLFISPTPVFFNDTLNDKRVDAATMEVVKRLNLRAVAVLPLQLGSRQIGALILEAEEPHNFTQTETRLFSALAPQVSTVLENRRQFERAQKQAERESMLNMISQKIQSATTVEAVLQIAARELGHALGAPLTIAQLGMKERDNGN